MTRVVFDLVSAGMEIDNNNTALLLHLSAEHEHSAVS